MTREVHLLAFGNTRSAGPWRHPTSTTAPRASLEPDTEIYLGLVHADDGALGARARIALAAEFLPDFGLSTECGLGRHSTEQLDAVLIAWHELASERAPALA